MSESVSVEIPSVGESITEVQIAQWLKSDGDHVDEGEDIAEIETEKASVPLIAPTSGTLSIAVAAEAFAAVGDVVATIAPGAKSSGDKTSGGSASGESASAETRTPSNNSDGGAPSRQSSGQDAPADQSGPIRTESDVIVMPAAARLLDEHGLSADDVPASGPGNRLLKEDVLSYVRQNNHRPPSRSPSSGGSQASTPQSLSPQPPVTGMTRSGEAAAGSLVTHTPPHRMEEVQSMSMMRRTIAGRLVQAQQTAALLTTFNEIDMQPVMSIRKKYKDAFLQKHGVKLGFMSFFAKAAVEALRRFPAINAEIRDANIVYRHYHDIGIAIGGGKGLVVPVLRNVERMSFADVERSIGDYAKLAGENRLQPEDLMGGTFTISNGGVYGSLLSTPIVNPPQSGILGLHSIQERPVAVDGEVVIRPMMYVALTYDHRIVDGREAVGFLKTIKEVIEDPSRLFLEI